MTPAPPPQPSPTDRRLALGPGAGRGPGRCAAAFAGHARAAVEPGPERPRIGPSGLQLPVAGTAGRGAALAHDDRSVAFGAHTGEAPPAPLQAVAQVLTPGAAPPPAARHEAPLAGATPPTPDAAPAPTTEPPAFTDRSVAAALAPVPAPLLESMPAPAAPPIAAPALITTKQPEAPPGSCRQRPNCRHPPSPPTRVPPARNPRHKRLPTARTSGRSRSSRRFGQPPRRRPSPTLRRRRCGSRPNGRRRNVSQPRAWTSSAGKQSNGRPPSRQRRGPRPRGWKRNAWKRRARRPCCRRPPGPKPRGRKPFARRAANRGRAPGSRAQGVGSEAGGRKGLGRAARGTASGACPAGSRQAGGGAHRGGTSGGRTPGGNAPGSGAGRRGTGGRRTPRGGTAGDGSAARRGGRPARSGRQCDAPVRYAPVLLEQRKAWPAVRAHRRPPRTRAVRRGLCAQDPAQHDDGHGGRGGRAAPHRPLVTVAIRSDGSIESVSFVVSSGVAAIDEAITRIVHSQAPYPAFPPGLARDFDVIEIRRSWHFDMAIRLY